MTVTLAGGEDTLPAYVDAAAGRHTGERRRGRSSELNPGYFLDSLKYLRAAEQQLDMPTLFDMSEVAS